MKKCPIVLASGCDYAMPLATALRSITESNRKNWPLEFYLLYNGFSEKTREKILYSLPEGSAAIHWVAVDIDLFKEFSGGMTPRKGPHPAPHLAPMAYSRFLIPEIVPEEVSRVLYLDVDVVVLDDLTPLLEADLAGATLGAVTDFFLHTAFEQKGIDPEEGRAKHPNWAGLPRIKEYFNSGVLLMDLAEWRKNRVSERSLEFLKRHANTFIFDQDALNVVCDGAWQRLDTRWNYQYHYRKDIEESGAAIVHFVSKFKPWLASSRHCNARFYDAFRKKTRFARTPFEKLSDRFTSLRTGIKNVIARGGFRREA